MYTTWPINNAGVGLVKEFELFVGHAYPDPMSPLGKELQARGLWRRVLAAPDGIPQDLMRLSGAPWTLGWGFTNGVRAGDVITLDAADARLSDELSELAHAIRNACQIEPNENQLAAFVCCAFNIGINGFLGSTMLKAHNREDFAAASRAFRLWSKSRGVEVVGLVRRRMAEATLYSRPVESRYQEDEVMPQKVDPESNLINSPIIRTSVFGGTAGTLGIISDTSRTFSDLKYNLGDWLPYVLLAIGIAAAGYLIYMRVKQRRKGFV